MSAQRADKVILAALLVDGTGGPVQRGVALRISGGRIASIGRRADLAPGDDLEIIDLGDATIMPGMIDAHMHFYGVQSTQTHTIPFEREPYRVLRAAGEARKMLEAGITAARCLGSSIGPDLKRAVNEGHVPGPRILAAGQYVIATDGTWDPIAVPVCHARNMDMLADGVDEIRAIIRRRVRSRSDFIKLGLSKGGSNNLNHPWGDDPMNQVMAYSLVEVKAAVEEAHINGLKVSAHCIGDEPVRLALDGGIDVIEHGHGVSEETRMRLRDENALLVSTLCQAYYHVAAAEEHHYPAAKKALWQRHVDRQRLDFEKNVALGIRYALGTDMIGYPTHPADHMAMEFQLAVEWGMPVGQAIVAGTKIAAEVMGLEKDIGTLEIGKFADVIAVPGNPLDDISILQKVGFVMKGGEVVVAQKPLGHG